MQRIRENNKRTHFNLVLCHCNSFLAHTQYLHANAMSNCRMSSYKLTIKPRLGFFFHWINYGMKSA